MGAGCEEEEVLVGYWTQALMGSEVPVWHSTGCVICCSWEFSVSEKALVQGLVGLLLR